MLQVHICIWEIKDNKKNNYNKKLVLYIVLFYCPIIYNDVLLVFEIFFSLVSN